MFVEAWCGLVFGVYRVSGLGCGLIAVIVRALVPLIPFRDLRGRGEVGLLLTMPGLCS